MGKLFIVGLGPGHEDGMTIESMRALEKSEILIGYTTYLDLLDDRFSNKELISTPMKQEIERCRIALEKASEGKIVSMICSGDSGVYGMASPILEMASEYENVDITVCPGVTAALSGAAVLGAPLSHDFCVISLSDLLTPWETIENRLRGAGIGDFCIAVYNPSSHKRADYLRRACDILLEYKDENTCCGYVENIGREGENYNICTLKELREVHVNMFTTVFIGNSQTRRIMDKMVTPRGYGISSINR